MTVVVTGASGHIGLNLVRALVAEKRSVRAVVHHNHQVLDGLGVEIVTGDVTDMASLTRALEGADVVYHLAGVISLLRNESPLVEKINIQGTRNVIEACRSSHVKRLVHFSSIHAINPEPLDVPVDENHPLIQGHRYPPYDLSKAEAQREIRKAIAAGLNAVVVNPTGVFGPYDYQPSFFGTALLMMANGQMPALIDGGFDWVDARDVAQGAILAEQKAPSGSEYLLSGHWVRCGRSVPLCRKFPVRPSPVLSARCRRPDSAPRLSPLTVGYLKNARFLPVSL